jgi:hypothetical protein
MDFSGCHLSGGWDQKVIFYRNPGGRRDLSVQSIVFSE